MLLPQVQRSYYVLLLLWHFLPSESVLRTVQWSSGKCFAQKEEHKEDKVSEVILNAYYLEVQYEHNAFLKLILTTSLWQQCLERCTISICLTWLPAVVGCPLHPSRFSRTTVSCFVQTFPSIALSDSYKRSCQPQRYILCGCSFSSRMYYNNPNHPEIPTKPCPLLNSMLS